MKRGATSASASRSELPAKRRKVKHETYQKWVRQYDRDCQTVTWLDCETGIKGGVKVVTKLKCRVCTKYRDRILGRKNFSDKWISGADSVRTTNVLDHAKSDQHVHAMNLLRRKQAQARSVSVATYAPIVQSLNTMSEDERRKLRAKFDIAYFVATEQLAFRKYPRICELEARHGVNLGSSYLHENAGKEFVHYIAESGRQDMLSKIAKAKFFSLLMDGSTDQSNADNELLLVLWCDPDGKDEKIHTRISYLSIHKPHHVTAEGLFQSLQHGLQNLGIQSVTKEACNKLVGIATDGAAANVAANGLKGLAEKELDWIFWMWCLAHRLELAIKDALRSTSFDLVDEMLLRLYYIYEKSPKKCSELESIVTDLKGAFGLDNDGAGIQPIRASGTRWVCHKLSAMKRVLSKYGAYTAHLTALSEDSSVKPADRAKFKGYLKKWVDAKYLLGCALFVDLLTPCAIFSKSMQSDELDILGALTYLLRTVKETNKLYVKPLDQWPTYAATLKKLTNEDGEWLYQGQVLKKLSEAKRHFESHCQEYCTCVTGRLRTRLSWSDLQLFRDIIFMLGTQGWQKIVDEHVDMSDNAEGTQQSEDPLDAIDRLVERFRFPLEGAAAEVSEIRGEFETMVEYATQFISLSTMEYQSVWWRLFHAPNSSEWSNVLCLASLLFSLPVSNGKLERAFSQVNLLKNSKRTSLGNDTLNDLLVLNTDKVPLQDFSPEAPIDLWWDAKTRKPSHGPRKQYKKRTPHGQTSVVQTSDTENSKEEEEEDKLLLDDWDEWMQDVCDSD